ncbi:hypothetical protein BC832DRAFT_566812 [Gaertneriomyces semiglobifer]|nr:hypothetical protein BC832DRAFT_566812 [Gaertneriomyces semiglobifer]
MATFLHLSELGYITCTATKTGTVPLAEQVCYISTWAKPSRSMPYATCTGQLGVTHPSLLFTVSTLVGTPRSATYRSLCRVVDDTSSVVTYQSSNMTSAVTSKNHRVHDHVFSESLVLIMCSE